MTENQPTSRPIDAFHDERNLTKKRPMVLSSRSNETGNRGQFLQWPDKKKKHFVEKFRLETAADGWRFVRMFQSPKRRGTRAAVALVLVAAI